MVAPDALHSQFFSRSLWRSNLISCERVAPDAGRLENAILPQFVAIEFHFVRKGCAGRLETAILLQFVAVEPHFVRKGCAGRLDLGIEKMAKMLELPTVTLAKMVRIGLPEFPGRTPCNRNFRDFRVLFGDRPSFRAKGLRPTT